MAGLGLVVTSMEFAINEAAGEQLHHNLDFCLTALLHNLHVHKSPSIGTFLAIKVFAGMHAVELSFSLACLSFFSKSFHMCAYVPQTLSPTRDGAVGWYKRPGKKHLYLAHFTF